MFRGAVELRGREEWKQDQRQVNPPPSLASWNLGALCPHRGPRSPSDEKRADRVQHYGNVQEGRQLNATTVPMVVTTSSGLCCADVPSLTSRIGAPLPLCPSPASFSPSVHGPLITACVPLSSRFLSRVEGPGEQGLGFAQRCIPSTQRSEL